MVINFSVKLGKIGLFTWNSETDCKLQYRHSDSTKFICDDLATLCVNLMNFRPVTLKFQRIVGVHPSDLTKIPWDKLSQDLLDQFSPNFHRVVGI